MSSLSRFKFWRRSRPGIQIAPNVWVDRSAIDQYQSAIAVESSLAGRSAWSEIRPDLEKAERQLRSSVAAAPLFLDALRALGRNLWFQGRHEEANRAFADSEHKRRDVALAAGWEPDAYAFLPRNCATVIGCMGHIDGFVKQKIMTGDTRTYYLLASEKVVNRVFLDYWAEHVSIVTSQDEIAKLTKLEPAYAVNWNWCLPRDNSVVHVHVGLADIQRRWHYEKRLPLLSLATEHQDLLAQQRREWGMSASDWYVCLHVRSSGFYDEASDTAQKFRNTPIEDYYEAIKAVLDRGGWVVRMGDASMPPLDPSQYGKSKRVIDYARSPEKSEALDVALCANCHLFISSPSGLHVVAHAFGRPCCPVNFRLSAGFPWHPGDIFTFTPYHAADGHKLSLPEIMSSDLVFADHQWLFDKAGVALGHNSPKDIAQAVLEALDPSSYTTPDDALARSVIDTFGRLNQQYGTEISGRLSQHYAWKHADTLLGTPSSQSSNQSRISSVVC